MADEHTIPMPPLRSGEIHMLMRSLRYFAHSQRYEVQKAKQGPDTPGNRHTMTDGRDQANAADLLLGKLQDALLRRT